MPNWHISPAITVTTLFSCKKRPKPVRIAARSRRNASSTMAVTPWRALCRLFVLRAMRNWCGSGAYRQNWRRRRYGLRRESFRNQSNSRPSFGRLLFLEGTPHRSLTSPYPFCPKGILTIRLRLPIYLHIRNTYHVKKLQFRLVLVTAFLSDFCRVTTFLSSSWCVLFSATTIYCVPLRPQTTNLDF